MQPVVIEDAGIEDIEEYTNDEDEYSDDGDEYAIVMRMVGRKEKAVGFPTA